MQSRSSCALASGEGGISFFGFLELKQGCKTEVIGDWIEKLPEERVMDQVWSMDLRKAVFDLDI